MPTVSFNTLFKPLPPVGKAQVVEYRELAAIADVSTLPKDEYQPGDEILSLADGLTYKMHATATDARLPESWVPLVNKPRQYANEDARLARNPFTPQPGEEFVVNGGILYLASLTTPTNPGTDRPVSGETQYLPTIQAGLGTSVTIASTTKPSFIHHNGGSGALTWDVSGAPDGAYHFATAFANEATIEIDGADHVSLNGFPQTQSTLPLAMGTPTFLSLTLNRTTGERWLNAFWFDLGSGIKTVEISAMQSDPLPPGTSALLSAPTASYAISLADGPGTWFLSSTDGSIQWNAADEPLIAAAIDIPTAIASIANGSRVILIGDRNQSFRFAGSTITQGPLVYRSATPLMIQRAGTVYEVTVLGSTNFVASPRQLTEADLAPYVSRGEVAPDPTIAILWVDTSNGGAVLNWSDGSAWFRN